MKLDLDSLEKEIADSPVNNSTDSWQNHQKDQVDSPKIQVQKVTSPQPEISFEEEVAPLKTLEFQEEESAEEKSEVEKGEGSFSDIQRLPRSIQTVNIKTEQLGPGQFLIYRRLIRRAETSLMCKFDNRNRSRIRAVHLIENKRFDNFILICIITNSICMAMYDYQFDNYCHYKTDNHTHNCHLDNASTWNRSLTVMGYIFSFIFTVEAMIKIFAFGCYNGRKTYLKNPWNVLDFIIVIFGVFEFFSEEFSVVQSFNIRFFRIIRILRPLKAMKTVPTMRKQISALLLSVKGFLNVIVFLGFIFVIFSSIGLQWFSGAIYYTCRVDEAPYVGDTSWNKTEPGVCTPVENQIFPSLIHYNKCAARSTCGSPLEFGLDPQKDSLTEDIQFGISSFDTFGQSLIAIFQIITLDNWSVVMFNLMNQQPIPLLGFVFCVTMIFLCSFFLINLMLAVMIESYIVSETQYKAELVEELQQEQVELRELKNRLVQRTASTSDMMRGLTSLGNMKKDVLKEKEIAVPVPEVRIALILPKLQAKKSVIELVTEEIKEDMQEDSFFSHEQNSALIPNKVEKSIDENVAAIDRLVNNSQLNIDDALNSKKSDGIPEWKSEDFDSSVSENQEVILDMRQNEPIISETGTPQIATPILSQREKPDVKKEEEATGLIIAQDSIVQSKSLHRMKSSIFKNLMARVLSRKLQKKVDKLENRFTRQPGSEQMTNIKDKFLAGVQSDDLALKEMTQKDLNIQKEILQNQIKGTYERRVADFSKTEFGVNADDYNFVRQSLKEVKKQGTVKHFLQDNKKVGNVRPSVVLEKHAQDAEYIASSLVGSEKIQLEKLSHFANLKNERVVDSLAQLVLLNMHDQLKSGKFKTKSEEENEQTAQAYQNVAIVEQAVSVMGTDMVEIRAAKNKCFFISYKIVDSKPFVYFITICILLNVGFLAFDKYPMPAWEEKLIEVSNMIFCVVFQIEMLLKLIGLGCSGYFSNRSNTLDFIIVVLSTADVSLFILLNYMVTEDDHTGNTFEIIGFQVSRVFRIFRILRIVKLTKSWDTFNSFVATIANAASKMTSFMVLLLLVNFIFTLMGLELFAQTSRFTYDNESTSYFGYNALNTSPKSSTHDTNFDNFIDASLTVFIIITGDGWMDAFSDHYRSSGEGRSTLFFVPLIVLGTYIVLNLFVTIMLQEFDQHTLKLVKEEKDGVKIKKPSISQRCFKRKDPDAIKDRSLFCFTRENKFREFMIEIAQSKAFDAFILVLIMVSSIFLAFESPLNDPEGTIYYILQQMDYATTAIFLMEMFIKILAFGFAFNGPKSYILEVANIVDFVIVTTSLVEIFLQGSHLSFFKVLRCARLLRPLRMISKNQNLKLSIFALLNSLPAVMTLLVIVILVQFVFAVIGINLFKGKSFYCDTDNLIGLTERQKDLSIITRHDCLNYGGEWSLNQFNYDDINGAMTQTLFMSLNMNLPKQMFAMMNASSDPQIVPGFKEKRYLAIYFVLSFLLLTFFMTNLFIAVVIAAFNQEYDKKGKNFLMTDEQKMLMNAQVLSLKMKPMMAFQREKLGCIRRIFYDLVTQPAFDYFIMVAISLNTIFMALKWPNMNKDIQRNLEVANYIFTAIFLVEAIFKLIAFCGSYFRDQWNVFDFVIVVASCTVMALENLATMNSAFRTTASLMRTLRIGRLFKIFKRLKKLQIIFQTFLNTFYSLLNVGGLMFLIIYIYAVIGVSFFADVKMRGPMHDRFNFQKTHTAFTTLMIVATGDDWNELFYTMADETECITNPKYSDYALAGTPVGCGNQYLTVFYFFSFALLISIIFLNLFIAIILNGYFDTRDQEKQTLNSEMLESFKEVWSTFDPTAQGHVQQSEFQNVMVKVGLPLGWKDTLPDEKVQTYLTTHGKQFKIEETHEKGRVIFFHDILDHIALLYIIKMELIADMKKQQGAQEEEKIQDNSSSSDTNSSNIEVPEVITSQHSRNITSKDTTTSGQIVPENDQTTPSKKQDISMYEKMKNRKQNKGKLTI